MTRIMYYTRNTYRRAAHNKFLLISLGIVAVFLSWWTS